jgi:hypothetical protein
MVALDAVAVELVELVGAQGGIGAVVAQQVGENDHDAVGNREDRFLLAAPAREPVELGGEIVARGVGDAPGDLAEGGAQPRVARGGCAT